MKFTALSAFLIACSLSLVLSHGAVGKEKDEDTDESESEVTIKKTVLARENDDKFEPVKSFNGIGGIAALYRSSSWISTASRTSTTLTDTMPATES